MKAPDVSFENIKAFFKKGGKKTALLTVIGFAGIILIFISELDFNSSREKERTSAAEGASPSEYCDRLESKVEEIVESIDGAGNSSVMITLSETTEYIYATNGRDTRKINEKSNDINNESDYVIIDKDNDDSGLLLKTIEPKVRGVAVVCEGGDNTKVQEQIYSAVGAVLNISTSRISISKLTATEEKK